VTLSMFTLFVRAGRKVRVLDVSNIEGKLIVTTLGSHLMWHNWRRRSSTRVRLAHTAHPCLDDPHQRFRARVIGSNKLELLGHDGYPILEDWVTSRGTISQPFPIELIDTKSVAGFLPSFPMVIVLFLFASLIAIFGHLDDVTAALCKLGGVVWAAVAAMSMRGRYWAYKTPIQRRLAEFHADLRVMNPSPQESERGEGRAINGEQLDQLFETFREFIKLRDMHYLCENIIKPLTYADQLSYADLVGPSMVTWFVSHCWSTPFREFAATLHKHAQTLHMDVSCSRYWICTFSNNQWAVKAELGSHIQDSSFYLALQSKHCSGTVMVIDGEALPLQRVWCLFEVATTYERTRSIRLKSAAERAHAYCDFEGLVLCTQTGVLNKGTADMDMAIQIAQKLLQIDLRKAAATKQDDKDAILRLVESMPGGLNSVNGFVRHGIRYALIAMHDAFEQDFEQLVRMLKNSQSTLSQILSSELLSAPSRQRSSFFSQMTDTAQEEPSALETGDGRPVPRPAAEPKLLAALRKSRAQLRTSSL